MSEVLKWRKVMPDYPKWAAFQDGKHVASVVVGIHPRVWIDAGDGFQELLDPLPEGRKELQAIAEAALIEARRRRETNV